MHKYISRTYNKIRNEITYSPLTEDTEIHDATPSKFPSFSTPTRGSTFWRSGRRLFQSNRSFKINKRDADFKPKKGKFRNLIDEFHLKIQGWSEEMRNNFHRRQSESKTPNCVTPNRKLRYMLGRTPEKLYSPFAIETPPTFKWHKFHDSSDDPVTNFYGWITPPKRNYRSRKLRT